MPRKPKPIAIPGYLPDPNKPTTPSWLPDPADGERRRLFGWNSEALMPYSPEELALLGNGEPMTALLNAIHDPELMVEGEGGKAVKLTGKGCRIIIAALLELRARNVDPSLRAEVEQLRSEMETRAERLERLCDRLPREQRQ